MRLVSTYAMLGMNEDAEQLCRRYFSDPPWIEYAAWVHARLLINLERWADLRQLAYRIRTFPMVMDALGGTSAYFEGLAEWREGYRENARRAFELAAQAGFNSPQMASEVADTLMSIGEIKFAEPILLRDSVRQALSNDRAYLMSLIKCAFYLRNTHYLADAATRLYRMYPTDPMIMNNYAASLLLVRTNVDQALIHTLRLSKAFPDNPDTKVNHATALIMNQRLGEADALLGEISPTLMGSDSSRAQYYMALFELRLRQGRKSEAQAALREVKTTELYPIQVEWIEKTALPELEALPEPPTGAGTG
jgi:tetratricopeptide (TPR) repeat protein